MRTFFLPASFLVASLLTGSMAAAVPQDAAATDDKEVSEAGADELYAAGLEAQGKGDWKEAESMFAKALTKRKHYQIQANLGASQLKLQKYREAAGNLRAALSDMRKSSNANGEQVRAVNNFLKEAEQQLVTLKVELSVMGHAPTETVRMTVDGDLVELVGGYLYLAPGDHQLEAQIKAAAERQFIAGRRGERRTLNFSLRPASAKALAPMDAGVGDAGGGGKPVWPIVVGAGLTAVGAGLAVAGFVVAGSAVTDEASNAVRTDSAGVEPHVACALPTNANIDSCNAWRDEFSTETNMLALGGAGVGLAASAAVATVVYLVWPSSGGDPEAASFTIAPQVEFGTASAASPGQTGGLGFVGLRVEGSF